MLFYQCDDHTGNRIKRLMCCFITILFLRFSISTPKNTPFLFCYPLKPVQIVHFPISSTTRLHQVLPQDYRKIAQRLPKGLEHIVYILNLWRGSELREVFHFIDDFFAGIWYK